MYILTMQYEQKPLKEALAPILDVLQQLGGKFTFMDDEGRRFVLASKEALEDEQALRPSQGKQQEFVFPQADSVARADDVIERINRDIALAASLEQLETQDEIEELVESSDNLNIPSETRIRFEAIKGDLAPDLQE